MDLKTLLETPPWEWPKNAAKEFHRILTDHHATESDRLVAAGLAGDLTVMNDDLADALMQILSSPDESEPLRAASAISLGPVLEQADMGDFDELDDVPISEQTFQQIKSLLHRLYLDASIDKEVLRRILEASVRAPADWHRDAIRKAYASTDRDWKLTAVFAMRWVSGFDDQILTALNSSDAEIHCEAVQAAGNWEVSAAWPHVVTLVNDAATPKPLLLAAIGAVGSIRPREAGEILRKRARSDDPEIAEAIEEAMLMAEGISDEEDFEEEDASGWIN